MKYEIDLSFKFMYSARPCESGRIINSFTGVNDKRIVGRGIYFQCSKKRGKV